MKRKACIDCFFCHLLEKRGLIYNVKTLNKPFGVSVRIMILIAAQGDGSVMIDVLCEGRNIIV